MLSLTIKLHLILKRGIKESRFRNQWMSHIRKPSFKLTFIRRHNECLSRREFIDTCIAVTSSLGRICRYYKSLSSATLSNTRNTFVLADGYQMYKNAQLNISYNKDSILTLLYGN